MENLYVNEDDEKKAELKYQEIANQMRLTLDKLKSPKFVEFEIFEHRITEALNSNKAIKKLKRVFLE